MSRNKKAESVPVYEVLVTFKSGAQVTVHMTELMFNNFGAHDCVPFFCPAPDYHHVFLCKGSIDAMVITGTVEEMEEGTEDEQGTEDEAANPD